MSNGLKMETSHPKVIRVGSRKSELALIQTNHVINSLKKVYSNITFEIVTMSTLGDRILNTALPKIGEKSLFTRELEEALQRGVVDFVVHSLKDLPTTLPEGLAIGAVFEREDPHDAVVLRDDLKDHSLESLPPKSIIGTSSLRRAAQLRALYPHLRVADVRGNLNTRLRKLNTMPQSSAGSPTSSEGDQPISAIPQQEYAALVLAQSGLVRMGWQDKISEVLLCSKMLYAVGQGALAVECRADNKCLLELLGLFNHAETYCRVLAERMFLKTLGGGCSAPVGVSSSLKQQDKGDGNQYKLSISGAVWSLDGSTKVDDKVEHSFVVLLNDPSVKRKLNCQQESLKKLKTGRISEANNPIGDLNKAIVEGYIGNCEPYAVKDEKLYAGMAANMNIPLEVLEKCEDLGKELAKKVIENGALGVMKLAQDYIRSFVQKC